MKEEVADILHCAHDQEGHFAAYIMIRKLQNYFWPKMAADIKTYILGCLYCVEYGITQRSQKLSPVSVDTPNTLIGIDFIGPFPAAQLSKSEAKKILWP